MMSSNPDTLLDRFVNQWTRAPSLRVEQFLSGTNEKNLAAEALLELLYTEITLRGDSGEVLELDEYVRRFPRLQGRLQNLFELRRILTSGDPGDASSLSPEDRDLISRVQTVRTSATLGRSVATAGGSSSGAFSRSAGLVDSSGSQPGQLETKAPTAATDAATLLDPSGTIPTDAVVSANSRFPKIPGYVIESELGRGGMGVVYRAHQVGLNRTVALKMILSGVHAHREELDRFRREAAAIARLQHPHIVQIYAIGELDGLPFFSLEYCEQGALDKSLRGTPLPPRQAAELVHKLAEAIQTAHDQGVIHRDLKPANILIGSDGRPKITDFGLAKQVDVQASGQTASGAIIGTPSYMAPEQAQGDTRNVGPAADIYALGALLYELLTGRPPFKAAMPMDTIRQVLEREPVAPVSLNQSLPSDLNTICLKCLEKKGDRRYASARDLADELARYLRGEPILARPVSRFERMRRWCRRNPAVARLAAVIVAGTALSIGALVAGLFWIKAERDVAEASRIEAEENRKEAEQQKAIADRLREQADRAREMEEQSRIEAVKQRDNAELRRREADESRKQAVIAARRATESEQSRAIALDLQMKLAKAEAEARQRESDARKAAEKNRIAAEVAEQKAKEALNEALKRRMMAERAQQEEAKARAKEAEARKESENRRREAEQALKLAETTLVESKRQRERAHFYLESFLNLKRFGRNLPSYPLRKDFDLKVRALAKTWSGNLKSASQPEISKADIANKRPVYIGRSAIAWPNSGGPAPSSYSLEIEADRDCYVTVFYALPEDKDGGCLRVFPNRLTPDNRIRKGTARIILQEPELRLAPVEIKSVPAYLYVFATDQPWKSEPDELQSNGFESFSERALTQLAARIKQIVERQPVMQSNPVLLTGRDPITQVAEEILMFGVRTDPVRGPVEAPKMAPSPPLPPNSGSPGRSQKGPSPPAPNPSNTP